MSTSKKINTPLLCEISSRGLSPEQLAVAVEAAGRTFWDPGDRRLVLWENFPPPTDGVRYRLGVVYISEVPTWSLAGANEETTKRGLSRCHPEVALYLREKYSQVELLSQLNGMRPEGAPEIEWVEILHSPVRDEHGTLRIFGLGGNDEKDFVLAVREFGDCYRNPFGAFIVRL